MQVKCTSCGASLNISQAQNCDFCGNLIDLENAKNNYQSFVNGKSGNLMSMAETAIEATNWEEALQFFNQVLTMDISNSDAWLGKGIAIVYTSKIGELKINEAIAYWKNALKHAPNQEAMGKRVAKEINEVVNKFYPTLENHFIQFKNLDNSYGELVNKFIILESAQNYAVELDPQNLTYSKTGYDLCKRIIDIPKSLANADYKDAIAGQIINGVLGALQGNKYTTSDAVSKGKKAENLKDLVNQASLLVYPLEEKYIENLHKLNPSEKIVRSREVFYNSKEGKEFEAKQIIANQGAIAGLKYRWNNMSDTKKAVIIISVTVYFLAAIFGGSK